MESTFKASKDNIGKEVYIMDPVSAKPDLIITFCVDSSACTADVEAQMLDVIFGAQGSQVQPRFFSPDNFTFGG
jgi:hypothetical protein